MSIESIADSFNSGEIGGGEAVREAMSEGYSYDEAVSSLTEAITSSTPEGVTYSEGRAVQPETYSPPTPPPPYSPPTPPRPSPATFTPQQQVGESLSAIVGKYQSGGFGTPGSAEAKRQVMKALASFWSRQGVPDDEAWQRATDTFSREFGTGAAAATGVKGAASAGSLASTSRTPADSFTASNQSIDDLRRELPTEPQFEAAVAEQTPSGGFGPLGNWMRRQESDLSNLYDWGQRSSSLPSAQNFKEFIGARGGINRVDPSAFRGFAESGSRVLTPGSDVGMTEEDAAWRDYLNDPAGGMGRQFDIGVAAGAPGISREARPYFERAAKRAFERFQFDEPEKSYLPHLVNRGFRFF